jgi:cytochrome c-type biogenesis protein CcmH
MASLPFVAAAALMTALALAWVLRPLLLPRTAAQDRTAEVDDGGNPTVQRGGGRRAAAAVAVALPLLAAGLYAWLGEPGALAPDSALDAQAAYDTLPATAVRAELVAHLARHPRDARGYILLARLDAGHDRFAEAAESYRKALAAAPKVERDPAIWCEYADALGMAQGGSLAGEPRALLMNALARNPAFGRALEMAGSAAFEAGDYTEAARYWRELARQLPDDAAKRELTAAVARAELLATGARR